MSPSWRFTVPSLAKGNCSASSAASVASYASSSNRLATTISDSSSRFLNSIAYQSLLCANATQPSASNLLRQRDTLLSRLCCNPFCAGLVPGVMVHLCTRDCRPCRLRSLALVVVCSAYISIILRARSSLSIWFGSHSRMVPLSALP